MHAGGCACLQVYVLGSRTVVTKRPSLGSKHMDAAAQRSGVMHLPRISCKAGPPASCQAASQLAASVSLDMDEFCEAPPEWLTHTLADVLRQRLGLQLFNFDLICPEEQRLPYECLYYVIDINYFPGVDKIPNFEQVGMDKWAGAPKRDGFKVAGGPGHGRARKKGRGRGGGGVAGAVGGHGHGRS